MKLYTKAYMDKLREYLRSGGCAEHSATLDDIPFTYFVVPQSENKDLLDFVLRCTGENHSDGSVFGISDHVPEACRPYAVFHEVVEFTKIGVATYRRCLIAVQRELALVPRSLRPIHLPMRLNFFNQLIPYALSHPEDFTPEDIREFQESFSRLETEIGFAHMMREF